MMNVNFANGFANNSSLTATGSTTFPTVGGNVVLPVAVRELLFANPLAKLTFIIQSNSPSATGPGTGGGGLGYGPDSPSGAPGIPNSIAIKFDLYSNQGEGINSTGLYIDGASPTVPSIDLTPSGVNLHSQDVMMCTLVYDGTT